MVAAMEVLSPSSTRRTPRLHLHHLHIVLLPAVVVQFQQLPFLTIKSSHLCGRWTLVRLSDFALSARLSESSGESGLNHVIEPRVDKVNANVIKSAAAGIVTLSLEQSRQCL